MQEYLNNPIIEDAKYYITNDKIEIKNKCTLFCNVERIKDIIPLNELLNMYKSITKEARNRRYSISYKQKIKDKIINEYTNYIQEVQKSNEIFDKMVELAKQIEQRKIRYGCNNDTVLNELTNLRNEYIKIYYRNSSTSLITEIKNKLERIQSDFKQNYDYMKIFL